MSLDASLSKAQQEVPECVAVGFVDMMTGMLLAVRTVDSHPQEVLDLVAAATADLFQGKSVSAIEKLFRKSRGQAEDGRHYFHEIVVFSENLKRCAEIADKLTVVRSITGKIPDHGQATYHLLTGYTPTPRMKDASSARSNCPFQLAICASE